VRLVARYLALLGVFVGVEWRLALEYRANLALDLFREAIIVASSLGALLVLFSHTSTLNGWSAAQMLVLLGVFYLIQGVQAVLFETSFEKFMEQVRLGTLDFVLLKPANSQFLVSTRHVQVAQLGQLAMGVGVIGLGVQQLGERISPGGALAFLVTLVAGIGLVYALLLTLSSLAFWFVRVENILAIFWSFLDAGRFPVDIYPGWLRVTLTTVVPIGIAVTVPAQAIDGRLDAPGLGLVALGSAAAWWLAARVWNRGLRGYTGAGG
jgi:ABC-2 type transport system permease protein